MPGPPLGFWVPAACSPAQSFGLVCPLLTVPAVVRSSRQATSCSSAPGTAIFDWRAQWPSPGLSAAAGPAVSSAVPRASAAEVARAAYRRRDVVVGRMGAIVRAARRGLNVGAAHSARVPGVPLTCRYAVRSPGGSGRRAQEVAGDLELATVLGQLLVHVQQHLALRGVLVPALGVRGRLIGARRPHPACEVGAQ